MRSTALLSILLATSTACIETEPPDDDVERTGPAIDEPEALGPGVLEAGTCPQYGILADSLRTPTELVVWYENNVQGAPGAQLDQAAASWNSAMQAMGRGLRFRKRILLTDPPARVRFQDLLIFWDAPCRSGQTVPNGSIAGADIYIASFAYCAGQSVYQPLLPGASNYWKKVGIHELGHAMGMDHTVFPTWGQCTSQVKGSSVMNQGCETDFLPNDGRGWQAADPTGCDKALYQIIYPPPPPPPTGGGGCLINCYEPPPSSPITLDLDGDGFHLTGASDGVAFVIGGDGIGYQLGWTAAGSDDAWLALDRDGNGTIDDGTELFGDATAQPPTDKPHGFKALAVFDDDGDGRITSADAIYASLRLWRDADHDGVSDAGELTSLEAHGVKSIGVVAQQSQRTNPHGNLFRYRAPVEYATGYRGGPFAYDVFLTLE